MLKWRAFLNVWRTVWRRKRSALGRERNADLGESVSRLAARSTWLAKKDRQKRMYANSYEHGVVRIFSNKAHTRLINIMYRVDLLLLRSIRQRLQYFKMVAYLVESGRLFSGRANDDVTTSSYVCEDSSSLVSYYTTDKRMGCHQLY